LFNDDRAAASVERAAALRAAAMNAARTADGYTDDSGGSEIIRAAGAATQTASHWGVYNVEMAHGGKILSVSPFARDADPSPIAHGLPALVYSDLRIDQPYIREGYLRHRAGVPHRRGPEPFVAVSWEAALGLVADELQRRADCSNTRRASAHPATVAACIRAGEGEIASTQGKDSAGTFPAISSASGTSATSVCSNLSAQLSEKRMGHIHHDVIHHEVMRPVAGNLNLTRINYCFPLWE
jgi:anaerobic selenocysteine-containing dehydrogenase